MTDLQKHYLAARKCGQTGHYKALRTVAENTGLDPETVGRCLDRAREADAVDERRARKTRKRKAAA